MLMPVRTSTVVLFRARTRNEDVRVIGTGGRTRARIVFPWLAKSIVGALTVGLHGLIFDFEFPDGGFRGSIRTPSRPGIVCYAFFLSLLSLSL